MNIISVDVGGTKISATKIDIDPQTQAVKKASLKQVLHIPTKAKGNKKEVLEQITQLIDTLINKQSIAITAGVPSILDRHNKKILKTTNIPSLKNISLSSYLHKKYKVAVYLENDANCFALAQKHFGKAKKYKHSVNITIGTGLGAGIILNNKLYPGHHHEAGEFGQIPYKDKTIEEYVSGKFFKNKYDKSAKEIHELAKKENVFAKKAYKEFSKHLAELLFAIQETYDPQIIVLGGSISLAKKYIQPTLKKEVKKRKQERNTIKYVFASTKNDVLLGATTLLKKDI
ncbi:MAG: ROK family protein [Candidatus Woesearchaeota archaeon]